MAKSINHNQFHVHTYQRETNSLPTEFLIIIDIHLHQQQHRSFLSLALPSAHGWMAIREKPGKMEITSIE
jgi:hypothetical protein